jgi:hypothetical protein
MVEYYACYTNAAYRNTPRDTKHNPTRSEVMFEFMSHLKKKQEIGKTILALCDFKWATLVSYSNL